jgi:type II secretory ATPase GspE/PulE/Tfp pilus assembly ATPase PilB-like protein
MLNIPTAQEAAKASEKARDEEAKRLKRHQLLEIESNIQNAIRAGANKATLSQVKILPEFIEELESKGYTLIKEGFLTTIKW